MQKITKTGIVLPHATGMQLLCKMVTTNVMFSRTRNVLRIISRNGDGFAREVQQNFLEEASGPVRKKEQAAVALWERSAAVEEELRYVTYLSLEHASSAMPNNAQYTKRTKVGEVDHVQFSKHDSFKGV